MPRWTLWMALTLLSWGVWAVLTRFGGDRISAAQSQAVSTLGMAPIILALLFMKEPEPAGNRRRGILVAFGAGLISCLGNIAFYAAVASGKAAAVIPLTALSPAVTILLAGPLLKERITRIQWFGLTLSLGAIYLFNAPTEGSNNTRWLLVALIPILLWGITLLLQKLSTDDVSARTSALSFLAAFVPVAIVILWREPLSQSLSLRDWAVQAALGFTLGFGNLTIMWALSGGGEASIVAPLANLYPVVSIPVAVTLLGEKIGLRDGAGIVLALAAVVLLSLQTTPEQADERPI